MQFDNNIPSENENRWTAFLNGEPGTRDISNLEADEIEDFTKVWESTGTNFSYSSANTDRAWLQLQKERTKLDKQQKFKIFRYHMLKYAAVVVILMGVGYLTFQVVQKPGKMPLVPISMTVVSTTAHPENYTVTTLPDGSTVKMNANTRIEYPASFVGNVRKVKLSGEGYFEVTHDTLHPFIIETANASVEVLGTSFNVSAYPNTGLVEVNVKTGKVKLTQYIEGKSASQSAVLPAGERGWLRVSDGEIVHCESLAPNYSAWITKEISFQRTPLAEAFSVLENIYHVKIKMESPEIGRILSNTNFANQNLDFIVDVLARTHKLKVKRNGEEIVFARISN